MKKFVLFFSFFILLVSCQSNSSWIYEDFSRDTDIVPVEYKSNYTFIDLNKGDIAKNASYYNDVSYFHDGIAWVKKDDYFFYINKKFEPINDKKYAEVSIFSDGLAFAVEDLGKITAINTRGKVVFELPNAEAACPFREGISVFLSGEGKCGAVDTKGNIVIDPCYDGLSYSYGGLLAAKIDGKYGIIDKTGKEIIPCKYKYIDVNYATKYLGSVVVKNDDHQFGAIDLKDNLILPYSDRYKFLIAEKNGMFYFYDRYGGWIDKKGKVIIPEKYYALDDFLSTNNIGTFQNQDVAVVAEDEDLVYLINKKGEKISDLPRIDWLDSAFDQNGLLLFGYNTFGAVNTRGELIIKDIYTDKIFHIGDDVYLGVNKHSLDVINSKGKVLKEITGDYGIIRYDHPDESVHNRYVDVDGIISDIDLILGENSMPNGITPGLVLAKYGLEDMVSGTVVASGEKPGFSYDFIVRRSYDYSSNSYYISSFELDLDLKGAADRVRNSIYSKIKEYYSGNDNSREVLVPTFSDYQSTFNNGTFTFNHVNNAWINGIWWADLGEGYAFVSINCNADWLVDDALAFENEGTTHKYFIENNAIKIKDGADYYLINYDEEALYYNGTVKMTRASRISY